MKNIIQVGENFVSKRVIKRSLERIIKDGGTCWGVDCSKCIFNETNCFEEYRTYKRKRKKEFKAFNLIEWKYNIAVRKYAELFGTERLMEFLL